MFVVFFEIREKQNWREAFPIKLFAYYCLYASKVIY